MDSYTSPFTHRYGSGPMHLIWADTTERNLWRATWLRMLLTLQIKELEQKQAEELLEMYSRCAGVSPESLEEAQRVELTTKHDVVAEMEVFKRILLVDLAKRLHAGATSSDVQDIANLIRIRWSTGILLVRLKDLCFQLCTMVTEHASNVCLGRTHLQPAEPTTLGYRLAVYLQELSSDLELLIDVCSLPGLHPEFARGVRGAVGTGANMLAISGNRENALNLMLISDHTPLVVGQTYPRTIEYRLSAILASVAATLHKLGLDMRYLQSLDLIRTGKTVGQIGSSAMPDKSNPIAMEKVCALSRKVVNLSRELWDAAALSMLERTLDDSAGRRSALPELFLSMDEALLSATRSLENTSVNVEAMEWECHEHWRQWLSSRALAQHRAIGLDDYLRIEEDVKTATSPFEFIRQYFGEVKFKDLYYLDFATWIAKYIANTVRDQLQDSLPNLIDGLMGDFPWTPPPPRS